MIMKPFTSKAKMNAQERCQLLEVVLLSFLPTKYTSLFLKGCTLLPSTATLQMIDSLQHSCNVTFCLLPWIKLEVQKLKAEVAMITRTLPRNPTILTQLLGLSSLFAASSASSNEWSVPNGPCPLRIDDDFLAGANENSVAANGRRKGRPCR